ncbi:type VII secretion protein EccB [Nocardia abscessus]|uniref:Type VII secretion protein EccB n=1 Tax=Nocardia abscessus TaxID=120957 RepID=A0ABS0C5M5_9NOCA|nr:type VII secretion protein EccB [Nocardia abscessus]MBF6225679.1 type VII secretion protein EccB [Nocardia abscessus]
MPAQLTTRAQVNGYRFLLRRLDHALVRRDVRMLHDPMRSQIRSLLVGAVLGVLVVAGAAILAFLRPQGAIGDALIVSGKQSGALYVVVQREDGGKTLHPVLNLASARLITGANAEPHAVKDSKLNDLPRGALLGIPGAPGALPGSAQGHDSEWSLCETIPLSEGGSAAASPGATTTVVAGRPALTDRIRTAGREEALLVRRDKKTYLVYDGKRAEVDPANSVMSRALELTAQRPRPVGTGLLGATTQVPPLTPPQIPQAGERGPGPLADIPVGGVISVSGVGRDGNSALYVVLADGVQPVSPFTAQVIRYADSHGMREIATVPPDVLDRVPVVQRLPIDDFPVRNPKILPAEDAPVTCVAWAKSPGAAPAQRDADAGDGPGERATVGLLVGTRLPIPESAKPVDLSTSDGVGDRVDAVYLSPGSGEYVQVTGMEPGSPRRGSLFYVADTGVRYGIPDAATANVLGLGNAPRLAPWAIIGQMVPGPTLSAREALVGHDSLPTQ